MSWRDAHTYFATLEFLYSGGTGAAARYAVAELIEDKIARFGFEPVAIDDGRDELITWAELRNVPPFVVQIGIQETPRAPGKLFAVMYPPLPYERIWLRKRSTVELVGRLSDACTAILSADPRCSDLRWLSETDEASSTSLVDAPPGPAEVHRRTSSSGDREVRHHDDDHEAQGH